MRRLHLLPFAALVLLIAGCAHVIEGPPREMLTGSYFHPTKEGFLQALFYFTEEQIADSRWEFERQRDALRSYGACRSGKLIVRRDIGWFDATPESGRRCATVVYTIKCARRPPDILDRTDIIREGMLTRAHRGSPIPKDCGEKDRARLPVSLALAEKEKKDTAAFNAMMSNDVQCPADPIIHGQLTLDADTRFIFRTKLDPGFARRFSDAKGRFLSDEADIFARYLDLGLYHALKPSAMTLLPGQPENPATDIIVTQTFAMNGDGTPYCLSLRAQRGNDVWQQSIVRSTEQSADMPMPGDNWLDEPEKRWNARVDISRLSKRLVNFMGLDLKNPDAAYYQALKDKKKAQVDRRRVRMKRSAAGTSTIR